MAPYDTPPPQVDDDIIVLSYPAPHILHVAMNRPKQLNAMSAKLSTALTKVIDWFEDEPQLWVLVLGTTSKRAWCAGADLKSWRTEGQSTMTRNGFGGLTERFTRKPIIGAINGYAFGGGSEMVANLDIAVAGENAQFGYPEVKRGVAISAGGLPRFVKLVGHQKAAELMLTGRPVPAQEALQLKMINYVVPDDQVDAKAIEIAKTIAGNSPDSVQAILNGIRLTGEFGSPQHAHRVWMDSAQLRAMYNGENIKEGLLAFSEKRLPKWTPSKL